MQAKTIEKILWWLILASMVLPIIVWSNALSPFHFGKVITFRILVEVMAVLWAALLLRSPDSRPRWTYLTIVVTAVTASFLLSTVLAADKLYAWWGTIERMGGAVTFLHYWLFYMILVSVVRSREQWMRLLRISVWVGVLSALYGLAQWLNIQTFLGIKIIGFQRSDPIGTAGNAAMFAGYLLFPLFWALYFALQGGVGEKSKAQGVRSAKNYDWWIYGGAFFVMALALVLANTRAPVGGFFIGLVVAAGLYGLKGRKPKSQAPNPKLQNGWSLGFGHWSLQSIALWLFVGLIVFAGFVFAFRDSSVLEGVPVLEQAESIRIENKTFQTRIWTWRSVWEGIKERPFVGWGPDNIFVPFNAAFNPRHFTGFGSETWFDRAHNLFFDLMTTQGIIGFTLNVAMFALLFRGIWKVRAWRGEKEERRNEQEENEIDGPLFASVFTGLVVAYLVHLLMLFDVFVTYFVFFLLVAFVDAGSAQKSKSAERGAQRSFAFFSFRSLTLASVAIVMVWMVWSWNIQVAIADYTHTRALLAKRQGLEKAIQLFDRAITMNKAPGRMEARLKLAQFATEVAERGGIVESGILVSEEDQKRLTVFAEQHVRDGVALHPLNAQHVIFLGRLQNSLAGIFGEEEKIEEAIEALRHGVELSPTRQRMIFELAQALVIDGRAEEALAVFDKALNDNPTLGVAYWYRGIVRGQVDDVEGALTDARRAQELGYDIYEDYSDLLRLINIHVRVENYERVAELYEAVVEQRPENPQYWASLAATYAQLGRYDDARRAAITAATIAPAFAPDVQEFINSLPK